MGARLPLAVLYCLVAGLTCWIYWPGLASPWMFDDYSTLDALLRYQSGDITAGELVFGERSGPSGRPLAMLSFLADYELLGLPPERLKVVNLGLHLLNGLLVASLLSFVLAEAGMARYRWWGVCAAGLWLLAPLQVSTVLYLVQRMAMLSAFFVLAALNLYALSLAPGRGGGACRLLQALAITVALAGVFAKENAIVALPLLVLLHLFVVGRRTGQPAVERLGVLPLAAAITACAALATAGFVHYAGGYADLDFTPGQRLLTETRVLLDYARQALWPDVGRLGIYHDDVPLSTSLLAPPATVAAVLFWVVAALAACYQLLFRRPSVPAFAVLFFLLAHALESSFLPLELYYEHRNYLPGVALFLLAGWAAAALATRFPETFRPAATVLGGYALVLALKLSSQVMVWSNPALLVLNDVAGHPASQRARLNYATHLARQGALGEALAQSAVAHELDPGEPLLDLRLRNFLLHCSAGGSPFSGPLVVDLPPGEATSPIRAVRPLSALAEAVAQGQCDRQSTRSLLDALAGVFLGKQARADAPALVYSRLAALENSLQRYDNALAYALRYADHRPASVTAQLMILHFATAVRAQDRVAAARATLSHWQQAGRLSPSEQRTLGYYAEH